MEDFNPLAFVVDEPLSVSAVTLKQIEALRASEQFTGLPGIDTVAERQRLIAAFGCLLDRLVAGLASNPRKAWVMEQVQPELEAFQSEDTEVRESFGTGVERIMDILCIESSNGLLSYYLGGV